MFEILCSVAAVLIGIATVVGVYLLDRHENPVSR